MKVQDERGNEIGTVISIAEDGTVVMDVTVTGSTPSRLVTNVGSGVPVRPAVEHHPRCRPECQGGTHYLTSEDES